MASKNLFVVLAIVAVTLPSVAMAAEIWVGGDKGWTTDFDYQTWAKDKVFNVGDTLVFNYTQGHHNVIKANKTAFDSCIKPPQNEVGSGRDVITLAAPGKKWYICGIASHCADHKQKLAITVEVGAPAPTAEPPTSSVSGIVASGYQVLMAAVVALGLVAIV